MAGRILRPNSWMFWPMKSAAWLPLSRFCADASSTLSFPLFCLDCCIIYAAIYRSQKKEGAPFFKNRSLPNAKTKKLGGSFLILAIPGLALLLVVLIAKNDSLPGRSQTQAPTPAIVAEKNPSASPEAKKSPPRSLKKKFRLLVWEDLGLP